MHATNGDHVPACAGMNHATRQQAKLTVTAKNNSDHLLYHKVTAADAACPQRLVSRRPFSRYAARLSNDYDPAKVRSDRVDSGSPLIQAASPQPRHVGETESPTLWHRACVRHVETLGCSRVGHVCLRVHHTVSAVCGH